MLNTFDWLRRSRTGSELLATLKYFEQRPDFPVSDEQIGPPFSALTGPCQRCWLYPRQAGQPYCATCQAILTSANRLGQTSRQAIIIWGYVNLLPRPIQNETGFYDVRPIGSYVHDERHFLLVLYHRDLKPCLQELVLYHGDELTGMLQVFPTMGAGEHIGMGDVVCRAVHQEAEFSKERLRVKFYADAIQVIRPRQRDRKGMLTFEVTDFLSLLEMAAVFRTILLPDEQKMLYELLHVDDTGEAQFYWGRLLGYLNQEAKDMLNAWKIRTWPASRIDLLYELVDYVAFYQTE